MRRNIVEGEPGIFPDPIARLLRTLGRLFTGARKRAERERQPDPPADRDAR